MLVIRCGDGGRQGCVSACQTSPVQLGSAVEHRVSVRGCEVRVVTAGSGSPPVFFDSALGTPLEAWSLVAPPVSHHSQVILWDRPGIGASGPILEMDAQGMAEVMAAVIDRAGGGPVVAVGHSRGGINVLALATCRPELVAGLVLVEPSHPEQLARMQSSDGSWLRVVDVLARAPRPVAQLPALAVRSLVRLAGDRIGPGHRAMAELAPTMASRLDGLAAEHLAGPALLADVGEKLTVRGLPDVPITVLTGDENFSDPEQQAVWAAMHAELADLTEQGRQIHVACGHEMPFSRPDAVTDAITGLLERVRRPPA